MENFRIQRLGKDHYVALWQDERERPCWTHFSSKKEALDYYHTMTSSIVDEEVDGSWLDAFTALKVVRHG